MCPSVEVRRSVASPPDSQLLPNYGGNCCCSASTTPTTTTTTVSSVSMMNGSDDIDAVARWDIVRGGGKRGNSGAVDRLLTENEAGTYFYWFTLTYIEYGRDETEI